MEDDALGFPWDLLYVPDSENWTTNLIFRSYERQSNDSSTAECERQSNNRSIAECERQLYMRYLYVMQIMDEHAACNRLLTLLYYRYQYLSKATIVVHDIVRMTLEIEQRIRHIMNVHSDLISFEYQERVELCK